MRLWTVSRLNSLLVTSLLVLMACAPAAAPATKPAPAPAAPAAPAAKPAPAAPAAPAETPKKQPKYGGILVNYLAWNPPSVDPLYASGQGDASLPAMYNGLVRNDFVDTSKVIPDLAERWEVSSDGRTYTFYLQKDVKWQDGKPFGAWDVQFTYDRTLDKAQLAQSGSWGKLTNELVASWKTIDDYTFQVTLRRPLVYFMNFLADPSSRIGPKHMFNATEKTVIPKEGEYRFGVGTGPFRMIKYEEGAIVEFVKNPNFWRKGLPYLDGVKRPIIGDRATQVAALASGRVMLGTLWPAQTPSEIKLIKEQAGNKVRIIPAYQNGGQDIGMQAGFPPMDNPKVRRAIFLAVDRWEVSERVYEGAGEPGTQLDTRLYRDWALPKEEVYKLPGLRKDKTADIAEAKRLLAEAGFPNGFEAIWQVRNTAEYIPTAQVVAAQVEKIGIKSKIESLDPSAGSKIIQQGKWHLGSLGGNTGYHALASLRGLRTPTTYANFNTQWIDSNKEFVDMYDKAETSLDPVEAKKLVWEIQRYLLTKDTRLFHAVWIDSPIVAWNQVKEYYPSVYGMFSGALDYTIIWLDQ